MRNLALIFHRTTIISKPPVFQSTFSLANISVLLYINTTYPTCQLITWIISKLKLPLNINGAVLPKRYQLHVSFRGLTCAESRYILKISQYSFYSMFKKNYGRDDRIKVHFNTCFFALKAKKVHTFLHQQRSLEYAILRISRLLILCNCQRQGYS